MWFSQLYRTPKLLILNEEIEFVSYYKILGICIQNKLNFDHQVNVVVSRINFIVRKLYNAGCYLPQKVKRNVATALCLPILEVFLVFQ